MTNIVKSLVENAVEQLADHFANAGCNDLQVPNTPEVKALWAEYNLWNCPEATGPEHDQWMRFPESDEPFVIVHDGFQIFLLKKELGLLCRG